MKKYLLLLLVSSLTLFSCSQAGTDTDTGTGIDKIDYGQEIGVDFNALSKDYELFKDDSTHSRNCRGKYTRPGSSARIKDRLLALEADYINCYVSDGDLTNGTTPKGAHFIEPEKLGVLFAALNAVENLDPDKQTKAAQIAKVLFDNTFASSTSKIDLSTYIAASDVTAASDVNAKINAGDTAVMAAVRAKNYSLLRYFTDLATTDELKNKLFTKNDHDNPLAIATYTKDLDSLILLSRADTAGNTHVNMQYDGQSLASIALYTTAGLNPDLSSLDPKFKTLMDILTLLHEKGLTSATVGKGAADDVQSFTNKDTKDMILNHLKELGWDNVPS